MKAYLLFSVTHLWFDFHEIQFGIRTRDSSASVYHTDLEVVAKNIKVLHFFLCINILCAFICLLKLIGYYLVQLY